MFGKSTPKPKREFVILDIKESNNKYIKFEASKRVLQEIEKKDFGELVKLVHGNVLYVTSLFDFNEVVEYLKSFQG